MDGWFHSGDVGELTDIGALKLIDRVKNFFKLAHGEYIAAEKLENIQKKVTLVDQIWVYGDSTKAQLLGFIVPDHAALCQWAQSQGLDTDDFAVSTQYKSTRRLFNPDVYFPPPDLSSSIICSIKHRKMNPKNVHVMRCFSVPPWATLLSMSASWLGDLSCSCWSRSEYQQRCSEQRFIIQ